MKYLLDTNICIYIFHDRTHAVRKRFRALRRGEAGISTITLSELQHGVFMSEDPDRNAMLLEKFLSAFVIIPYGTDAARTYGSTLAKLTKLGREADTMDALIASHALSLDAILVTNNTRDFRRIPGLRLENWAK